MHYEIFSASKSKTGVRPSDDVTLFIPGVLAAVFDGATDPYGHKVNGKSSGRFAAEIAAQACAKLFSAKESMQLSGKEILDHLANDLEAHIAKQGFTGVPSTTMALVLFQDEAARLLIVGDSGIRINQGQVYRHEKLIDDITTMARTTVFSILRERIVNEDDLEAATRSVAFLGFENAVQHNVLSQAEAKIVINKVRNKFSEHRMPNDIEKLLGKGIQYQHNYSNNMDHPLGFGTLNGSAPSMSDVVELTFPISELQSIEIFSDGYPKLPTGSSVADWEAAHNHVEQSDYHKISAYPSVKGSTSTEYFDDRSIVSISLLCKILS